jgi:histone H3/H4
MEFSTRSMHNLIRNQGDLQVSEPSATELGEILERFAGDIAEVAIEKAQKEGYQTVKEEHIRQALR